MKLAFRVSVDIIAEMTKGLKRVKMEEKAECHKSDLTSTSLDGPSVLPLNFSGHKVCRSECSQLCMYYGPYRGILRHEESRLKVTFFLLFYSIFVLSFKASYSDSCQFIMIYGLSKGQWDIISLQWMLYLPIVDRRDQCFNPLIRRTVLLSAQYKAAFNDASVFVWPHVCVLVVWVGWGGARGRG